MKIIKKLLTVSILFAILMVTSCRTEETEIIQAPPEEILQVNSAVATLMKNTATNDGSADNIIDNANCFSIQLPVTVIVNGLEITVDSEDDFDTIEAIFDEFEDDDDDLEIQFPIVIITSDYTQITINNLAEFNTFSANCNGPNVSDDDIECLDFQYPIVASIFNSNNELLETITIQNDEQMYDFIDDINVNDIINIQFPITVITFDGLTITVNNLNELASTINSYDDACDEDDDYDYNDDDCNDCTNDQLANVLTQCTNWSVDKLERNDTDLEDNFIGYTFNFTTDGIINITSGSGNFAGTWTASGSGNNISVTITVSDFPDFNNTWLLHEIEQDDETKVDLRLGDDRLRFESDCTNNGGTNNLSTTLSDGIWIVSSYTDDGNDETANYNGYQLNFNSNGTVIADNGTPINGTWATQSSGNELVLNFGTAIPFDEFNDDWDVVSITPTQVKVQDVSGGSGGTDILIFDKL